MIRRVHLNMKGYNKLTGPPGIRTRFLYDDQNYIYGKKNFFIFLYSKKSIRFSTYIYNEKRNSLYVLLSAHDLGNLFIFDLDSMVSKKNK